MAQVLRLRSQRRSFQHRKPDMEMAVLHYKQDQFTVQNFKSLSDSKVNKAQECSLLLGTFILSLFTCHNSTFVYVAAQAIGLLQLIEFLRAWSLVSNCGQNTVDIMNFGNSLFASMKLITLNQSWHSIESLQTFILQRLLLRLLFNNCVL